MIEIIRAKLAVSSRVPARIFIFPGAEIYRHENSYIRKAERWRRRLPRSNGVYQGLALRMKRVSYWKKNLQEIFIDDNTKFNLDENDHYY